MQGDIAQALKGKGKGSPILTRLKGKGLQHNARGLSNILLQSNKAPLFMQTWWGRQPTW